jgi:hypothetical protein
MSDQIDLQEDDKKREPSIRRKIRQESEQSLLDYMQELSTTGAFEIKIHRKVPKTWLGKNIEGLLGVFDEPVTEAELFELYGGGHYLLEFYAPDNSGKNRPVGQRVVKIAGDPKLVVSEAALAQTSIVRDGDPGIIKETLRMNERQLDRAEQRAKEAEERADERVRRGDPAMAMIMAEQRELRSLIAEKDRQMIDMIREQSKPQESRPQDRIFERLVDGESARIESIVVKHNAEVAAMRERHNAEVDRLQARMDDSLRRQDDAHQRGLSDLRDAHKREVDSIHRAHDQQVLVSTAANGSLIEGYKREISHLDRQLTTSQTELVELRVKKDKGLIETITEIATAKEALASLGGGDEPKEESSTIERVINGVVNSSLAQGIAERLANGPGGAPQAQARVPSSPAEIPENVRFEGADGNMYIRRGNKIMALRRKTGGPVPTGQVFPPVDPTVVAQAVQFMEGAFRNGTEPEAFAASARSLVPDSVVNALRAQGVDVFLSNVAQLDASSSLHSIAGKTWARKVVAMLVGDGAE